MNDENNTDIIDFVDNSSVDMSMDSERQLTSSDEEFVEQTVSSGDALSSVSSGDAGTTTEIVVTSDNTDILSSLSDVNYTCSAILFFIVFTWVEAKIKNACRKEIPKDE